MLFFLQKVFDEGEHFHLCHFEVVVDDDFIEVGGLLNFKLGTLDALLDDFGSFGATLFEAAAKLFNAGGLDEDAEGTFAVDLLKALGSVDVDVEGYVVTVFQPWFHLRLEGSVELVGIDFFVLDEVAVVYLLAKLVGCVEMVFLAILLVASRKAGGGGDGEVDAELVTASVVHHKID